MIIAVQDLYLNTLMAQFKYMHLPISIILGKIIQQYSLRGNLVTNGSWVYIEICKGIMYRHNIRLETSRYHHMSMTQHPLW